MEDLVRYQTVILSVELWDRSSNWTSYICLRMCDPTAPKVITRDQPPSVGIA